MFALQVSGASPREHREYCLACHKHVCATECATGQVRTRTDNPAAYQALVKVLSLHPTQKAKTAQEVQDEQHEMDIVGKFAEGTSVHPRKEAEFLSIVACVLSRPWKYA